MLAQRKRHRSFGCRKALSTTKGLGLINHPHPATRPPLEQSDGNSGAFDLECATKYRRPSIMSSRRPQNNSSRPCPECICPRNEALARKVERVRRGRPIHDCVVVRDLQLAPSRLREQQRRLVNDADVVTRHAVPLCWRIAPSRLHRMC